MAAALLAYPGRVPTEKAGILTGRAGAEELDGQMKSQGTADMFALKKDYSVFVVYHKKYIFFQNQTQYYPIIIS